MCEYLINLRGKYISLSFYAVMHHMSTLYSLQTRHENVTVFEIQQLVLSFLQRWLCIRVQEITRS